MVDEVALVSSMMAWFLARTDWRRQHVERCCLAKTDDAEDECKSLTPEGPEQRKEECFKHL